MAKQTKKGEELDQESDIQKEVQEQSEQTGRVPAEPKIVYPVPQPDDAPVEEETTEKTDE